MRTPLEPNKWASGRITITLRVSLTRSKADQKEYFEVRRTRVVMIRGGIYSFKIHTGIFRSHPQLTACVGRSPFSSQFPTLDAYSQQEYFLLFLPVVFPVVFMNIVVSKHGSS